jgi:hypothetical protein
MQNHKVLENDIDVNEIYGFARAAGFSRLSLKVATDMDMSLEEHNILFGAPRGSEHDRLKSVLWNQTYNTMTNRAIFFLHKGPLRLDSRSHIGLAHEIKADQTHYVTQAGHPILISFTLSNTGEAEWLHTNSQIFGIVRLASHLYDEAGSLISVDFSRDNLPATVKPGQTVQMTISVSLPGPGAYGLVFDLVAEGVTWFENVGAKPVLIQAEMKEML